MISLIPINLLRFLLLVIFQVLFFSNIHLHPYIEIFIYPIFILLLPFDIPRWLLLLVSFGYGLTIDVLLGTLGMHAAVCVFLAFFRGGIISLITPKGVDFELSPNIYIQGAGWFSIYCTIAYTIIISGYLIIENGTFHNLFLLLLKIIASLTISVLVSLMLIYIFTKDKRRRHTGN